MVQDITDEEEGTPALNGVAPQPNEETSTPPISTEVPEVDEDVEVLMSRAEREQASMRLLFLERKQKKEAQAHARAVAEAEAANSPPPPPPVVDNSANEGFGYVAEEFVTALGGGGADAVNEVVDLFTEDESYNLNVQPNTSTAGQVGRGLVQFITGFIPAVRALGLVGRSSKALNAINTAGKGIPKAMVAGATADAVVFDPHQARVSNLILDMSDEEPAIYTPILEYLKSDEEDSQAEGRFKNAVEGFLIGGAFEVLLKGLRGVKQHYSSRGENASEKTIEQVDKLREERVEPTLNKEAVDEPIKLDSKGKPIEQPVKPDEPVQHIFKLDKNGKPIEVEVTPSREHVIKTVKPKRVKELFNAATKGDITAKDTVVDEVAGDINLASTPEDYHAMRDKLASALTPVVKGVQTHELVKELAETLGESPAKIMQLYENVKQLPEMMAAMDMLVKKQLSSLNKLVDAYDVNTSTVLDELEIKKQLIAYDVLVSDLVHAGSQTARALNARKIMGEPMSTGLNKADIEMLVDMNGGRKTIQSLIGKVKAAKGNPRRQKDLIREGWMKRSVNALTSVYVNGLLSGPHTPIINASTNLLLFFDDLATRSGGVLVGKSPFRHKNNLTDESVGKSLNETSDNFDAVRVRAWSTMEAMKQSFRLASDAREAAGGPKKGPLNKEGVGNVWKTARSGQSQTDPRGGTKAELQFDQNNPISAENFGLSKPKGPVTPSNITAYSIDALGGVIGSPGRLLLATDELFKTTSYTAEIYEQAFHKAAAEGFLIGTKEMGERIAQLVTKPSAIMKEEALRIARANTLTDRLGEIGTGFTKIVDSSHVGRFLVPFIQVPTNIIKFPLKRTAGINRLMPSVRAEYAAGGRRADIQTAKVAMMSSLYAMFGYLAAEGKITGSYDTITKAEKNAGKLHNAIKIGDKWHAVDRYTPLSFPLLFSAQVHHMVTNNEHGVGGKEEEEQLAVEAILTSLQYANNLAPTAGLVDLVGAISSGSEAKFDKWWATWGDKVIPFSGARRAYTKTVDPFIREKYDTWDHINANRGLENPPVNPQVDEFGEDKPKPTVFGPAAFSPQYTSTESKDPVKLELAAMDITFPRISRKLRVGELDMELTKDQYYRLQKLVGKEGKLGGKNFHENLSDLIKSSTYTNKPEYDPASEVKSIREDMIRDTFTMYLEKGRQLLMEEFPEIKEEQIRLFNQERKEKLGIKPLTWLDPDLKTKNS